MRSIRTLALLALLAAPAAADTPSEVLDAYVRREQPSYGWKVKSTEMAGNLALVKFELTSQVWEGITWKHRLNLLVPKAAEGERARPNHALLVITGSGGEAEHIRVVSAVASQLGVPVAILHDVPNQPLFKRESKNGKGLREDALIAYTFQKYAETGDSDWPALLPMTRSAVAAMDALGEFSAQATNWQFGKLEKFMTCGGSKRGWTTWLTACVDKRVVGIAPVVYDNLNIPAQLALHFKTWGKPSPSIRDYTERGLHQLLRSDRGKELLRIVDPYVYRDRLTVPKMAMIGTNDTYWPLEAIHLYRGKLPGHLYCHYVPNSGHGVGPSIVQAIVGFFDHVTGRIPDLPEARMNVMPHDGTRVKLLSGADTVQAVRVWASRVDGKDFTKSAWTKVEARPGEDGWRAALPDDVRDTDSGHAAFIGELELPTSNGTTFVIHTPVQVWELGKHK
jgi:PhoPQ-activated pathogenicity-related protein